MRFWPLLAVLGSTFLVAWADHVTAFEVDIGKFYFVPICLATWWMGRAWGLGFAAGCALLWLADEVLTRPGAYGAFFPYLNAVTRLTIFALAAHVLAALLKAQKAERELARTDPLTGAANTRQFYETANKELSRARRSGRPLTVAYLDLDDFKAVNDTLGHAAGDEVLRQFAGHILRQIRAPDSLARLGGDEFAILLPETDAPAAHAVLQRIQSGVREQFRRQNRSVSVSIGAVTFRSLPENVEALLREADRLMFAVKREGKDGLRQETRPSPSLYGQTFDPVAGAR